MWSWPQAQYAYCPLRTVGFLRCLGPERPPALTDQKGRDRPCSRTRSVAAERAQIPALPAFELGPAPLQVCTQALQRRNQVRRLDRGIQSQSALRAPRPERYRRTAAPYSTSPRSYAASFLIA